MTTRRSLTLLVLIVAVCAPASAQAKKTTDKASMQLAMRSAKAPAKPTATIHVIFTPPKSLAGAATGCKGKVAISVPTGKKTVKKKRVTVFSKKSASLKKMSSTCTATATLKLPDALYGKTLKFTALFKGNDKIKKFSKSAKLTVMAPAVPAPAPAPGGPFTPLGFPLQLGDWTIIESPSPDTAWFAQVTAGNTFTFPAGAYPPKTIACTGHTPKQLPAGLPIFDTPFSANLTTTTATDIWTDGTQTAIQNFQLTFDSASHATGTYSINGMFMTDGALNPCAATYSVVAQAGAAG